MSVFVSFERFWDGPQRVCPHRRQSWVDSMCQVDVFVFGMLHIYICKNVYIYDLYIYLHIIEYIYNIYIYTYICMYTYVFMTWNVPCCKLDPFFFSTKLCYVLMCCAVCFSPDAISWCCFPSPCLFGISNVGTFAVDFRACPHGPVAHLGTWLQLTI